MKMDPTLVAAVGVPVKLEETVIERAFKDLESPVCDLKNMSILVELAIENTHQVENQDCAGDIEMHMSRDEFNSMHFAVMHLGDMIRKFHDAYYEAYHADRPARG